jgi:parallel beta-helix repeat protein
MTLNASLCPFDQFFGLDGKPLENGYVYIGVVGLDPIANPVPIFYDAALTIPAPNPMRTIAGYVSNAGTPANVFTSGNYSIKVADKNNVQIYYVANFLETTNFNDLRTDLAAPSGSSLVGYHSGQITVEAQLDMLYYGIANLLDKSYAGGADPTGVVPMDTVWSAIVAAGKKYIYVPPSCTFTAAASLVVPANTTVLGQGTIKATAQPTYHLISGLSSDNITIDGVTLDGNATTNAGLWYSASFNLCNNLRILNCNFVNAVASGVRLLDCDRAKVIGINCIAQSTRPALNTAPYAVYLDGCSSSIVADSTAKYTDFGFVMVGANLPVSSVSSRPVDDTVGNIISNCTVSNYAGVAFDINGCHGNSILNCTANNWVDKASGYYAGFQIKNTPSTIEARANKISGCTSYKGAVAYMIQNGSNAMFSNNIARLCSRQGLLQNGGKYVQISGLIIDGYGSISGSGDEVSAVQVQNGADYTTIDGITLTPATYQYVNGITIAGSNECSIDNVDIIPGYVRGGSNESLRTGISFDSTSSNTTIGSNMTIGQIVYVNKPISDVSSSASTIYPITCSSAINVTTTGNKPLQNVPQRGMIIGRIRYITLNATSGSPTIQCGKVGNTAFYKVAAAPAPAAGGQVVTDTSTLISQFINANEFPLINVAVAGAAGDVVVAYDGLSAL